MRDIREWYSHSRSSLEIIPCVLFENRVQYTLRTVCILERDNLAHYGGKYGNQEENIFKNFGLEENE